MSDLIDNGGYRFWDDDFSFQSAYEDCKAVFDGITDDDAFQECDTGIILYHAHEIMYALKKALPSAQPEPQWMPRSEPPEEDGVYIVYAPDYSGGSSSAKECHNGVMFSKYKNGKWSIEHGYYSRPDCVKAWKPLDEPWRGEGEHK